MLYDLLHEKNPVSVLKEIDAMGILSDLFPELIALKRSTDETSHKDNFVHTLGVLQNVVNAGDCMEMRLVALLHDLGKAKTMRKVKGVNGQDKVTFHDHESVSSKMLPHLYVKYQIPQNTFDYVNTIVKFHGRPKNMCAEGVTDSAIRRLATDASIYFKDLITFAKRDITTSQQWRRDKYETQFEAVYTRHLEIVKSDTELAWQPEFRGNHIMDMGFKGKMISIIKNDIMTKIKNNELENTIEACKKYVLNTYAEN